MPDPADPTAALIDHLKADAARLRQELADLSAWVARTRAIDLERERDLERACAEYKAGLGYARAFATACAEHTEGMTDPLPRATADAALAQLTAYEANGDSWAEPEAEPVPDGA